MTLLFRSKSCRLACDSSNSPPSSSVWEEETEETEDEDEDEDEDYESCDPISTPFISPEFDTTTTNNNANSRKETAQNGNNNGQFPILTFVAAALRKSLLVTCSVEREDVVSSMDISCPTDVQHVSHVTFDRFKGFLGVPDEFHPDVLTRVPSASASVFGVSPHSMQCSLDERGNSVPTILLMMQKYLYAEGGLQAEGIFRITAENSQEESVRNQLNKGIVPEGIDVHCSAGLIKAWFRELPKGVLDCLTPEQVMHCNTEEQCTQLVKMLPPMEAALLDWAINLMADVVQNEQYNKMNARNIAMVFAPNMTQMADPLTALIHAVQVMNFLKTLIVRTIQLREESAEKERVLSSCPDFSSTSCSKQHKSISIGELIFEKRQNRITSASSDQAHNKKFQRSITLDRLEFSPEKKHKKSQKKDVDEVKTYSTPVMSTVSEPGDEDREVEGILERLNFRKGVKKLCRHPVFQLSKPSKKTAELEIVNSR